MKIPRLDLKRLAGASDGGPFRRDSVKKPIQFLLSRDAVQDKSDRLTNFLLGFGHHPLVQVYVESDSPTPGSFVMGELRRQSDSLAIRLYHREDYTDTGMWPYSQWERIASEEAGARNEPFDLWHKDLILAQASAFAEIDVLVTASNRLLASDKHYALVANPMSVRDAVALLGLYLRGHGDFTIRQGEGRMTYNRGLFYWVATRDLLRESWRWFSALNDYWQATKDQSLLMLGQSALQRFDRSLRGRDAVHLQMVVPHNNDTADEAMAQFDTILVFLLGAFDASAQVFHRSVGLPGGKYAGWHRTRWVETVCSYVPGIAGIVGPGSDGENVLKILAALRNSIHGEALQAIAFQDSIIGPRETLIQPPMSEHAQLIESIEKLGGKTAWGLRDLLPEAAGLEVDTFVDTLFASVTRLLNQLMRATPVERLAGVNPSTLPDGPPNEDEIFGARQRQWIADLMGFL